MRSRWEFVPGKSGPVLEYELWEDARVQARRLDGGGSIELLVRYRDPSPSRVNFKTRIGDYDGLEIKSFHEELDTLKDVQANCGPEKWAEFMEDLAQVYVVLDVLRS